MTTRYQVVQANTEEEAKAKCTFKEGELVKVIQVEACRNGNGTFSMFPIVEPLTKQDQK